MDYEKKIREYMVRSKVDQLYKSMLINLFPELKESEDEKVRKEIIDFATKANNGITSILANNYNFNKWLAWLEKQGEQKSNSVLDIEIPLGAKDSELQEASYYIPEGFHAEIDGNRVVIKRGEQKPAETVKWSPQEESCICQLESLVKEQWRQADKVHNSVNIKKMSELMFFLKTLNPNKKPQRIISAEAKEAMYDKPAEWSEDDKNKINRLIAYFEDKESFTAEDDVVYANWLKDLKDRVQPQLKQEWSKEDDEKLKWLCRIIHSCKVRKEISLAEESEIGSWVDKWLDYAPQSQWKPSLGQLECLGYAIEKAEKDWYPLTNNRIYLTLKALKEQLEKL